MRIIISPAKKMVVDTDFVLNLASKEYSKAVEPAGITFSNDYIYKKNWTFLLPGSML